TGTKSLPCTSAAADGLQQRGVGSAVLHVSPEYYLRITAHGKLQVSQKIRPDAFIYTAVKAVDLSGQEEALEEKFRIVFKERIQALFDEFLFLEAAERLAGVYPALRQKIEYTPLSNRTKNCLLAADVITVGDLVQYSPGELRSLRNMGEKSVKEIENFVAGLGI
ncbi:MAG: hypothetical protein IJ161_11345, partial [Bacteroidales bacterium]|nr:hypothetical protein [Bacteroidales bacterium]